jgi:hypothetical protein
MGNPAAISQGVVFVVLRSLLQTPNPSVLLQENSQSNRCPAQDAIVRRANTSLECLLKVANCKDDR